MIPYYKRNEALQGGTRVQLLLLPHGTVQCECSLRELQLPQYEGFYLRNG